MDVQEVSIGLTRCFLVWSVRVLLFGTAQAASEEFPQNMVGDVGVGGYYTRSIVRGNSDVLGVFPRF